MAKIYTPPQQILERYAKVLIHAGLGDGHGIKKGQTVVLRVPEAARPLLVEIYKEVLRAGGQPLMRYTPDGLQRAYFELASDAQLDFFPAKFAKGMVDQADHYVAIIAETNMQELSGIDPQKIMRSGRANKPMSEWMNEKENKGKFHWTLGMYGTPAMAKEAGLSQKEYWNQIIKACYLNEKDPVARWHRTQKEIQAVAAKLTKLGIDHVHVSAPGTNLIVGFHPKHKWIGGTGRNIPSFECFTSPDFRRTEGTITFTEPLYRYGNKATGISLTFKAGKVVDVKAKTGAAWLKKMIAEKGANMIGEYSLTDSRHSEITKFMADTLFDENVGGRYGNTHLALGKAYHDCYQSDPAKVTKKQWETMGYNDSAVHTDIVATSDRTVTATLRNGKTVVIYKNGQFQV